MEDPKGFETTVLRRLSSLEEHLINNIVIAQDINRTFSGRTAHQLIQALQTPLSVDDRNMKLILSEFTKQLSNFNESCKNLDIGRAMAEMKFIGKKLQAIEERMEKITNEGIDRNVRLDFSIDGYKMTKKFLYDRVEEDEEVIKKREEDLMKTLLDSFTARESIVLCMRVGLVGEKQNTYGTIGDKYKICASRAREIYMKCVRKLRKEPMLTMVKKIDNTRLNKVVFETEEGEE